MLLIALYVGSVNALTDDVEALRAENAALREEIERLRAHSDDARFKAMEINTSDSLGELEEDEAGKATGTGSKGCGQKYAWMNKGGFSFEEGCRMSEDQFKTQTSGHRLMPLCQKEKKRGKTYYVDCQTCPKSGDCTTNPNATISAFANEPKWSIRGNTDKDDNPVELGKVTCPCALADGKPMDSTTALRTIVGQVAKLGIPADWKWTEDPAKKPICDKKQETPSWREAAWNAKVMVSTMQMFRCWKESCSAEGGAGQLAASEDVQLSGLLEGANLREETELDALVGGGACIGGRGWELF